MGSLFISAMKSFHPWKSLNSRSKTISKNCFSGGFSVRLISSTFVFGSTALLDGLISWRLQQEFTSDVVQYFFEGHFKTRRLHKLILGDQCEILEFSFQTIFSLQTHLFLVASSR